MLCLYMEHRDDRGVQVWIDLSTITLCILTNYNAVLKGGLCGESDVQLTEIFQLN